MGNLSSEDFINELKWDFYEMVDAEIPGTIATIGHFIFISVEG
jgi:hypothetical protein